MQHSVMTRGKNLILTQPQSKYGTVIAMFWVTPSEVKKLKFEILDYLNQAQSIVIAKFYKIGVLLLQNFVRILRVM
jgi:hypothetical protein